MKPGIKEQIDEYLKNESTRPKIIIIYGPTGCGKTVLALEVSQYLCDLHLAALPTSHFQLPINEGEFRHSPTPSLSYQSPISPFIVSVDSRQIYRYMDIGTGKILPHEMRGISHSGLDLVDPDVTFSMVNFRHVIESLPVWQKWLRSIGLHRWIYQSGPDCFVPHNDRNTELATPHSPLPTPTLLPILCGGTWLYIDGLIYDMQYPDTPPDWGYREALEKIRIEEWNQILWNMLEVVDPDYAHELSVNNFRYVIRGLEVIRATGRSKRESHGKKIPRFSPLFLTPYTDIERSELYARIDKRVEWMFKNWLLEEVEYIMNNFKSNCPGLATIGYKEVVDHLEWRLSLEESIRLVQQHSRNYAKRQITWNKRYE